MSSSNPSDYNSAANGRPSKRRKTIPVDIYDVNYLLTEGVFDFEAFENKNILEMLDKW